MKKITIFDGKYSSPGSSFTEGKDGVISISVSDNHEIIKIKQIKVDLEFKGLKYVLAIKNDPIIQPSKENN